MYGAAVFEVLKLIRQIITLRFMYCILRYLHDTDTLVQISPKILKIVLDHTMAYRVSTQKSEAIKSFLTFTDDSVLYYDP